MLKTVNYRESDEIFPRARRIVGRFSICRRFLTLVPVSQPSIAGARARHPTTLADRLAAATPSPTSPLLRPLAVGVVLPSPATDS